MNKDITFWTGIFSNLSAISIAIPLMASVIRYKRHTAIARIVFYFILVSAVMEIIFTFLADLGIQNLQLITIWVAIESAFLFIIYRQALPKSWRKLDFLIVVSVILLCLLTWFYWNESDSYSSVVRSVQSGLFMLLCLAYYYQLLDNLKITSLSREPMFWFNTAFFMYFAGNLFFFMATKAFRPDSPEEELDLLKKLLVIYNMFVILRNLLIAVGFWRIPKRWT